MPVRDPRGPSLYAHRAPSAEPEPWRKTEAPSPDSSRRSLLDLRPDGFPTEAGFPTEMRTMPKKKRDVPPLPAGKTLKEMLLILGHCRFAGMESPEAEACCRSQGIELAELRAFDRWYEESGGVVFASEENETRALLDAQEKERRKLEKVLRRKEKQLAEIEALLKLSKKVKALREGKL